MQRSGMLAASAAAAAAAATSASLQPSALAPCARMRRPRRAANTHARPVSISTVRLTDESVDGFRRRRRSPPSLPPRERRKYCRASGGQTLTEKFN